MVQNYKLDKAYKKRKQRRLRRLKNVLWLILLVVAFAGMVWGVVALFFTDKGNEYLSQKNDPTPTPTLSPTPSPSPTSTPSPTPTPVLARGVVMLDPGHGGADPGCVSLDGTVLEKDITHAVCQILKDKLEARDFIVYVTETQTEDGGKVDALQRVAYTKEHEDVDIFVSVHVNSYAALESVNGIEIYCYERENSIELSNTIIIDLIAETGARNRGVKYDPLLIVTREIPVPACLIEIGFITNPEEFANMTSIVYQEKIAYGIAQGIETYFDNYIND